MSVPSQNTVITQGRVRAAFTIEIQCVIEGAELENFTYTWNVNGGKLMANGLADGKASRVGWLSPGQGGQYKIAVLVQDKAGNQAVGEVNMEVLCCKDP
jgi:hypothetical protein